MKEKLQKEIDTIKAEFAIFFSEVEKNLPKTRAMAELGNEKIAQAIFPAYVQMREYLKSKSST